MWERMTGNSANEVFVNAANSSEKRVEKDEKRKSSQKAKECRRKSKYSQNDDSIAARKKRKKDIHIERIYRDVMWWKEQIPKLKDFYFCALFPELASPRQGIGCIREPEVATITYID